MFTTATEYYSSLLAQEKLQYNNASLEGVYFVCR